MRPASSRETSLCPQTGQYVSSLGMMDSLSDHARHSNAKPLMGGYLILVQRLPEFDPVVFRVFDRRKATIRRILHLADNLDACRFERRHQRVQILNNVVDHELCVVRAKVIAVLRKDAP